MEGRWVRLTLSAVYDGVDVSDISRDDPVTLYRERLLLEEANRRRMLRYLEINALAVTGAGISSEDRYKILNATRTAARDILFPWMKEAPEAELKQYEDYYHRVMAIKHERDRRRAEKNGGRDTKTG